MTWGRRALAAVAAVLLSGSLLGCGSARRGITTDGLKGVGESATTREALEEAFDPQRYALLIGINNYDDPAFPSLRYAHNDATAMGRLLEDGGYGGFHHVSVVVTPEETGRDALLRQLRWLERHLERDDSLVVYFSGHGTLQLDREGEPRLYLVASDTRARDLAGTGIDLPELQAFFSRIRARRKALVIDACYNGVGKSALPPSVQFELSQVQNSRGLSNRVRLGESEAHLFATALGTPARELPALEHGVYTYHLLQALSWEQGESDANRDGLITAWEAHDHARKATIRTTAGEQIPEAYLRVVGGDDLVIAGDPTARVHLDQALVFYYGSEDGVAWDGASLEVDGELKGILPATLPIEAGQRRVVIRSPQGEVLYDELVELVAGRSYQATALEQPVRRSPWSLRWSGVVRGSFLGDGPSVFGGFGTGAEFGVRFHRQRWPIRDLSWGVSVGYGPSLPGTNPTSIGPRHHIWGSLQIGFRKEIGPVALGLGVVGRLHYLSQVDECADLSCLPWIAGSAALQAEQLLPLGRGVRLALGEEIGLSLLDLEAEGTPRPSMDLRFTAGVEFAL